MALDSLEDLSQLNLIHLETEDTDSVRAIRDAALAAIGRHRLLSADEERVLADQITAGKAAAARLSQNGELATETRCALEAAVAAGEQAREAIMRANMRLVMAVAHRYRGGGLSYEDLVQEGAIGLLKAIDRYDSALGFRFSTYATWWIRQAIRRALIEQGRSLRLPEHLVGFLSQLHKAALTIEQREGRPATIAEIADAIATTTDRVEAALTVNRIPSSLDAPCSEDGRTLGEVVADGQPTIEETAAEGSLASVLQAALATLPERQRLVLMLRHGLDGHEPRTLAQVGEQLDISRERVRQLEAEALRQLRAQAGDLRAYLH